MRARREMALRAAPHAALVLVDEAGMCAPCARARAARRVRADAAARISFFCWKKRSEQTEVRSRAVTYAFSSFPAPW